MHSCSALKIEDCGRLNLRHRLLSSLEQTLEVFTLNLRRRILLVPHYFMRRRGVRVIEQSNSRS